MRLVVFLIWILIGLGSYYYLDMKGKIEKWLPKKFIVTVSEQQALAKAKILHDAEVKHMHLGQEKGLVYWQIGFVGGGRVEINAMNSDVISVELPKLPPAHPAITREKAIELASVVVSGTVKDTDLDTEDGENYYRDIGFIWWWRVSIDAEKGIILDKELPVKCDF